MVQISVSIEDKIVVTRFEGTVGFEDITEHVAENYDSWDGNAVIWDIENMDLEKISSAEMRRATKIISSMSLEKRRDEDAVVAPKDVQFGLMRMLQIFAELDNLPIRFRLFRTIGEAKAWLSQVRNRLELRS